jgi:tetraacyldisaccharide 4'-kinase
MKRARLILLPCSLLYGLVVLLRNWFFDIGIYKTTRVRVPVISIGNISAGGVGKTPIVEMLTEKLSSGKQIAVVSRGYGRKSKGTVVASDGKGTIALVEATGDEPNQLARKFSNLIVVVDEKRTRGAQKAIELGAEMILLDDGFQHRYLQRDLNLVVMTAEEIIDGDWLLPAGNRREPLSSLKRADGLIITRCMNSEQFAIATGMMKTRLEAVSDRFLNGYGIIGLQTKFKLFKQSATNEFAEAGKFVGKKIIAVSGIGSPESFESLLQNAGMTVEKHFAFSDHHWFSDEDIRTIIKTRRALGADFIITTEKDFMRLRERFTEFIKTEQVVVAEIQQVFIAGKDTLEALIQHIRQ